MKNGVIYKYDVESLTEVFYEESDTTLQGTNISGKVGEYAYVDLGLESGVKWATFNVGAQKPSDYGEYFAWGETVSKTRYGWDNYALCNSKSESDYGQITKYCLDNTSEYYDQKFYLEPEDDAAFANWGEGWRMPTNSDWEELKEGCVWKWEENYYGSGNKGILGTSRRNGNKIFLPISGSKTFLETSFCDYYAYYWASSSAREKTSENAGCFFFYFYGGNIGIRIDIKEDNRFIGCPIRPITNGE